MRIIEPRTFTAAKKQKKHKKRVRILTAVGLLLLIIIPFSIKENTVDAPAMQHASVDDKAATTSSVAGAQSTGETLRNFTDAQFHELYEALALPNTELISVPPDITGNQAADARIRTLAEKRGYELRSIPVLPIIKTNVAGLDQDDLLQPKAFEAWLLLEKAAKKDGIALKLNSGYRSIDWQRRYFLAQLQARGAYFSSIANGQADSTLQAVMNVVAPPGYSRHHTGYTIDLICKDGSGRTFEFTSCFNWLSKDNYKVAKQNGWVPSYPDGADNQGPEPESWEYVWVGTETTYE